MIISTSSCYKKYILSVMGCFHFCSYYVLHIIKHITANMKQVKCIRFHIQKLYLLIILSICTFLYLKLATAEY